MRVTRGIVKDGFFTAPIGKSWNGQELYLLQVDTRSIREEQRAFFFAVAKPTAEFCGYTPEELKDIIYSDFESKYGYRPTLSLKGNRDDANKLIEILLTVVIDLGLAFGLDLSKYDPQEIEHWEHTAIKNKFCVICGKQPADVAHVKAIGMGRNRDKVKFSESLAFSLCREHHNEQHSLGIESFKNKYHIYGVKV